jgi:drug/metabolite transporter (DMT)-like permease
MLGYALQHLDPMTYQVVFKAFSIFATAMFSKLLLKQALHPIQYCALGALLVGAFLCSDLSLHAAAAEFWAMGSRASWTSGLLATISGAVSFALHLVWFERSAGRFAGGTVAHSAALSLYGFLANIAVLCTLHAPWAIAEGVGLLRSMRRADGVAALSIALADLSAAVFVQTLSANAYTFSRTASLLVSGALSSVLFGLRLGAHFWLSTAVVIASGVAYHEHEAINACWTAQGQARLPLQWAAMQAHLVATQEVRHKYMPVSASDEMRTVL